MCSSVIPYVTDQLALARLPRATYALMIALLPAVATAIGILVLGQWPSARELLGVALVVVGVAVHRAPAPPPAVATGPATASAPDRRARDTAGSGGRTAGSVRVAADPRPRAGARGRRSGGRRRELVAPADRVQRGALGGRAARAMRRRDQLGRVEAHAVL